MASDSSKISSGNRLINPWVLHFQKMGLELKCPLCLNMFNQPILFPCNHIFCSSCVPKSTELGFECSVCNEHHVEQDLRSAPFIENMVKIYQSLDASFSNMIQPVTSDAAKVLEQFPILVKADSGVNMSKEPVQIAQEVNSSIGQSTVSLIGNKRVHVGSNHSFEDMVGKNVKTDVTNAPRNGNGVSAGLKEFGTPTTVVNQVVAHTSPGCPPSDDSSYQSSEHNQEKYLGKRPAEGNSNNNGTQDHERDLKRQKQLYYGPSDVLNSELQIEPVVSSGPQGPILSEDLVANNSVCGFCLTSGFSEVTGEMFHYVCGNRVVGHKANNPNAIHVHEHCIEWAPQVYYDGETIKNLDKELARGAKLKCFKCGLKGAALGCLSKTCRRTYHLPCAKKDNCRWETEGFLMLCPAHSHFKFPSEKKYKSRNLALENIPVPTPQITSQQSSLCGGSPNGGKELVLCGSALSSAEKHLLMEFARTRGATVSKFWRPDITHVIASTDADGACARTIKVLSAILSGQWVLNINWVKASMATKLPVGEEPYEVNRDNHGCSDGPKTGRLRVLSNAPKLFNGLKFYFSGDFVPGYKGDLQNLVVRGGGIVLTSKEDLVLYGRDDQGAPSSILIVYNIDPPQGSKLGDEVSILWERLNDAEDLAAKIGSRVIGHMWILESIASCRLQPIVT